MNIQDAFLNQVRVTKTPVLVYLIGGHQLKGMITGFDSFVLIMETEGREHLVYKHAVTTIMPQRKLTVMKTEKKEEKAGEQTDEQDN